MTGSGDRGGSSSDLARQAGLVVGAASGIGRAIAERLAAHETNLMLVDRDQAVVEVASALGAHAAVEDVGREGAEDAIAEVVMQTVGEPDFLVYCAGIQRRGSALELADADWGALEDVNWFGARRVITRIARLMVSAGKPGAIVNITSSSVRSVTHGIIPYSVTKAALEQLTRGLAAELGPAGIRVNGIAPGYVKTAMTRDVLDDPRFVEGLQPRIPLGYVGEPADVAGPVLFLLSDEARYVTGVILPVDGGFTLGALRSP